MITREGDVFFRAAGVGLPAVVLLLMVGIPLVLPAATFPLRWRWSNPLPHGNNIISIAYSPTLNRAVEVTERGQIYTSSDLFLWTPRESGTTNALRSVTFFGPAATPRLIIVGEATKILWSDGLENYQPATVAGGTQTNWLFGVAASSNLLVAVGSGGAVYTSYNGTAWARLNSFSSRQFNSVAWGPAGFVAVTEDGYIFQSTSGTNNWQPRYANALVRWDSVYFGNGIYQAVGTGGNSAASTNGTAWVEILTDATQELLTAASGAGVGGVHRVAAGDAEVRVLEPGTSTWADAFARPSPPPSWTYLSAFSLPNFFLIAGRTGVLSEGYKTNATKPYLWLASSGSFRPWLFDSTYSSNLYVAVGDHGTVMTSGNGVDWNLELVPSGVTNSVLLGVGGTSNLLVAVGEQGSMIVSSNALVVVISPGGQTNLINGFGVIWNERPRLTTNDLQGVTSAHGRFVVTGDNGSIFTSADGSTWTDQSLPTNSFLFGVSGYPGGFVAVGEGGVIWRSDDGFAWHPVVSPTPTTLWRVRYLGDLLLAVGDGGQLLSSFDGNNWRSNYTGTTYWLHDVCKVDDSWLAFGKFGTFLSSQDTTNWMPRDIITLKSVYTAATDGQQIIAAGIEGIILRAPVAPIVTPVSILSYKQVAGTNGDSSNNLFLFGGKTDQRFTLDYRSVFDTNQWIRGPMLEFYDGSGTLIYLDPLSLHPPNSEFYRTTSVP